MLNQPPRDRIQRPRELTTRAGQVRREAVFSPETPGYEEWLRRQALPPKLEIGNRKLKI